MGCSQTAQLKKIYLLFCLRFGVEEDEDPSRGCWSPQVKARNSTVDGTPNKRSSGDISSDLPTTGARAGAWAGARARGRAH